MKKIKLSLIALTLVFAASMVQAGGFHLSICLPFFAPVTPVYVMPAPQPPPVLVIPAQPAPVVEMVSICPGDGYVWVGGYWTWIGTQWTWVRGGWNYHPIYWGNREHWHSNYGYRR